MIYYRIASQKRQSTEWEWKTEIVTSLEEVFRLRQEYHFLPAEQLRVFMASSVAYLDVLIVRENLSLPSNSLTMDQLLLDHHTITIGRIRRFEQALGWYEGSVPELPEQAGELAPAMVSEATSETAEAGEIAPAMTSEAVPIPEPDHEPGGDHDVPYTFAFPKFLPHALAWIQLRERVLSGELDS